MFMINQFSSFHPVQYPLDGTLGSRLQETPTRRPHKYFHKAQFCIYRVRTKEANQFSLHTIGRRRFSQWNPTSSLLPQLYVILSQPASLAPVPNYTLIKTSRVHTNPTFVLSLAPIFNEFLRFDELNCCLCGSNCGPLARSNARGECHARDEKADMRSTKS